MTKAQRKEWRSYAARRGWNKRKVAAEIAAARRAGQMSGTPWRPFLNDVERRGAKCRTYGRLRWRACPNPAEFISYGVGFPGYVVSCGRCLGKTGSRPANG